jgi:hypothetical protein
LTHIEMARYRRYAWEVVKLRRALYVSIEHA